MASQIYVAGTRTFAAEVIDYAIDAGLEVIGLLEPREREKVSTTVHERPVSWLDDGPTTQDRVVVVGTGENDRRGTVERLQSAGWEVSALVHPSAHVAPSTTIGSGSLIAPGVVIGARSRVGDHVVVGRGSLIGHHTELGPFATLGPGANVAGNVRMGEDVFVGMGAVVRDHVEIGASAVIAMGAVVVRDVAEGTQVRGLPATAAG
jgi:sugar O-acyltransferase (sialic acid O-acetyltransferase NeuD family)